MTNKHHSLRNANFATATMALCELLAATTHAAAPCPSSSSNAEQPWLDTASTPECRADALIAKLTTIDQKLEALGAGFQRFGVKEGGGSDGPAGPTHAPNAAVLPNGMTLASAFDPELARAYGVVVAREFKAAGMRRMLGPTVDIARTWHSGRVPESFGEDPWLSSQIAAPLVSAIQKEGVAVTLKHFAIYTQEQGRTGDLPFGLHPAVNNVVSERVMREIYLPPFRAAVVDGGALGAMCAFPRINGVYACENTMLLGILKSEWGMRGTVGPDFPDAQRTVIAAVNAGLDFGNFGLPRPPRPTAPPAAAGPAAPAGPDLGDALGLGNIPGGVDLKTAIANGQVSESRLNDMLRRKLVMTFAVGAEQASGPESSPTRVADAAALALRVAEQGAVLLRNERNVLPLAASVKSIAVIGTQAGAGAQRSTPGSAYVDSKTFTSAIDAIKARAGAINVSYSDGSLRLGALPVIPAAAFGMVDGKQGLKVEYYANHALKFEGAAIHSAIDAGVDIRKPAPVAGLPGNNGWSARWTGVLNPRSSGPHNFSIAGAGSARLFLNNKLVARFDRVDFGAVAYTTATLERGIAVPVRVEFTPREAAPLPGMNMMGTSLGTLMTLGWAEPDDRIARAVEAARKADVAVIFAADSHGEGADRTELGLPGDQDALITAVAAANRNTVVILNTAGPVAMPWASKVAAILEMWYPGDALGKASSRLLFGDASPQGRLPITFPVDATQGPVTAAKNYPGTVDATGALDVAHFDEGLLVGYRWYDARAQRPLFAFGHGLTYSPLQIEKVTLPQRSGGRLQATVRNSGKRNDSEVVQVYVGFPAAEGEPPQKLAAFARVAVAAGEQRTIELDVPDSAFQRWDENTRQWRAVKGKFQVMVGRSSRDIVYRGEMTR